MLSASTLLGDTDHALVKKSVVKVYSIQRGYSLTSPWKRLTSKTVSGSGVLIASDQVLTNYHVVAMSTDVSISLDGQSERLSGTVEATAPGIDLALIRLETAVADQVTPLEVASSTPKSGSKIQVFGYPKGGESISITEGVVSRREHVRYKYRTYGLRTQIDAPLNSGNSGGPMIADNKIVGIAFSGLSSSNDIGYAIACEEINEFLEDVKDGSYDGKPQLWLHSQTLASKDMRRWLNMPDGSTGIKFAAMPIPVDDYPLQFNDVITHIGSFDVNNLGKVNLDDNTQVSYVHAVEQSAEDGIVPAKILRDGKSMDVELPVFRDPHYLLDHQPDRPPTYFVYGPIVFGVATADFLSSFDALVARGGSSGRAASAVLSIMQQSENPYFTRRYDRVKDKDQELVVISKLISNRMTRDTRVALPAVVRSINGQKITSIREAAERINSLDEDLLVIEFEDNRGTTIVFDRDAIESSHQEIMEENAIFNSSSKNLSDVWDR
ncbi:MAG: trypsin-like serine protease [Pirellulaceae bacterium]|nr:trypsin-like serine protease [Pirellulaceae bacterium]